MSLPSLSRHLSRRLAGAAMAAVALAAAASAARANEGRFTYEVTVTNITYQQRFTPLLAATHQPAIRFFTLGQPALPQLATLAEEGNVAPLRAVLDGSALVRATAAGNALLDPGKSVTLRIEGNPWTDRLSLAAMLIPTNDAFVAVDAMPLPMPGRPAHHLTAIAYDAGSEINDELCASIPGPFFSECGGSGGGARAGGGEGFVHVHRGMHGVGDFRAIARDWRNPVAQVSVRLVH